MLLSLILTYTKRNKMHSFIVPHIATETWLSRHLTSYLNHEYMDVCGNETTSVKHLQELTIDYETRFLSV